MYLGRIVAIAMTKAGYPAVLYRVSSRSFPNREARVIDGRVAVMPRPGFEDDLSKNPYIAYNCLRIEGVHAIATNGSHTDPIAEKIAAGMPPRDALSLGLLAMDYEKDSYDTPRVAAVVTQDSGRSFLGIVRKDALLVREFSLEPGQAYYLSTYEKNAPCDTSVDAGFDASTAAAACVYSVSGGVFAGFEHPVTAAAAMATDGGFETATLLL